MNPQLQIMLSQAIQAFETGNFERAESILKKVIHVDAKNLPALNILGLIKASQARYQEASEFLGRAARINPNDATIQYNLAKSLHDFGDLKESIPHHKKAVELAVSNPKAWLNYGITLLDLNQHEQALDCFDKVLSLAPDYIEALINKAVTLNALKRYDEAIAHYDKALDLNPDYAEGWYNKANTLNIIKRHDEAIAHYDKALILKPDYVEGWYAKGVTLLELKRYDEAIAHYDKAIDLKPDYVEGWHNKGVTLNELKRYDEALIYYDKALDLNPDYAEGWYNKGVTLNELKRYDEAIAHYDKALELNPDYAEGWHNKGVTLNELKRYDEALDHYDKALSLNPGYAEGWSNIGNILNELKRYDEALIYYDKALGLKPDYVEGWYNKGVTLNELKRYDEAITHYAKALSLKPNIDWVYGDLVAIKMKICDWLDLDYSLEYLSKRILANEKVANPFLMLVLNANIFLHKKTSENYIKSRYLSNPILGPINKRPLNEKVRIGYFSADFRRHPVAFLIAELFELHDKSQFEIYAFSLVKDMGEMRDRLNKAFDHFIDVQGMSDAEIANLSRDLGIEIAVDLTGFTQHSRTGIFAHRAAPIQVNYLGYPGTLGADYMDYIIADRTLISPELQPYYTEKVVYLPNSYQVNDRKRIISERQFTRQELGLPEDGFVFCCFNNNFKILPATFASWMRILKAVEGSVLWLFRDNSSAAENLKKEAENHGISSDRLMFAERMLLSEHLARHRNADLFLDTFPYNAHTTSSDALWTGLPLLTLMGQSFASRVAASLLNAIDLPELITTNQEQYEALAIELATNPQKLAKIKLKLANNRLTTPLFDTPLFTKNLEAAYIQMYDRYQAGLEPDHISII